MKDIYTKIDTIARQGEHVMTQTESIISPVRASLFRRFPILATLLVTFGIVATFFGMERMIAEIAWLNDRPFIIFFAGISALVISGKLYQKLG